MDHAQRRADEWTARHHGVITHHRARVLGLSDDQIFRRLRSGSWRAAHRGVYLDARMPTHPLQQLLAAVAAGGRGAVGSHLSAAWMWGLVDDPPVRPWVTVPPDRRVRIARIRTARSRDVRAVVIDGVPTTPLIRTLVDCAAHVHPDVLDRLVARALAKRPEAVTCLPRLGTSGPLDARRGTARLRGAVIRAGYDGPVPPSALERKMARLVQRAGIGTPVREHPVVIDGQRYRLDFAHPPLLFASEVDGYAYHSSPAQLRTDRRRRNALLRAGWRVPVYTWRDVTEEPERVIAELRAEHEAAVRRAARGETPTAPFVGS